MNGLSLHYYTRISKDWAIQGSATEFEENEWFSLMQNAFYMEELIAKHSHIMDQYDPEKKVGLIVDEWGTWFSVEPGTNPGFLYQQNTLRDALVAGIHFNLFNNHCDRVQMANIAQMVNVLQAVVLTEGDKMLLTPTYHAFDMFKVHQDAELLSLDFESPYYTYNGDKIPQLSISSSQDKDGKIHVSICNLSPVQDIDIDIDVRGITAHCVSGKILTSRTMNAKNTFEDSNNVKIDVLGDTQLENNHVKCQIPSKSVVVLELV
jgi:alpha-N-arabinofuranosidase